MKLKQRVIMMSSLSLTMVLLFVIGTHLMSWTRSDSHDSPASKDPPPPDKPTEPVISHSSEPARSINVASRARGNQLRPGVPDAVLERLKLQKSPQEMLDELLREQKELSHRGRFPLSDMAVKQDPKRDLWTVWKQWVTEDHFYPEGAFYSADMNRILEALTTSPVTEFGVGYRGTQLKASMMLGDQRTVFKPRRYSREEVIEGNAYAGFDRHNGEIAGFHLDGILGFRLAPPVAGRKVNLTALLPVTTEKLKATYIQKGKDLCFYGVCHYCRAEEAACADGEIMEGSVTLWLPAWYQLKTRRHPYQRTYRRGHPARWERDASYCKNQILNPSSDFYHGVLEYTDTAVYDFLMGNADRHHYEVFASAQPHGRLVHIDNGKTFGNPHHDEMSILAPLTQCCRLRTSTWDRLQALEHSSEGKLSEILDKSLRRDPLYPILSDAHLTAIDRRLEKVMTAVRQCIVEQGQDVVIVDSWR